MSLFQAIDAAMNEPDLADAVAHLQRACEITDGANAYRWFDCIAHEQWEANISGSRIALLMDYLGHEYTFKQWEPEA
jgi:hypothetical protein